MNFHDAEVRALRRRRRRATRTTTRSTSTPASAGRPDRAPEYYALLLFGRFAQGTATSSGADAPRRDGLERPGGAARRLFLIDKSDHAVTVTLPTPAGMSFRSTA